MITPEPSTMPRDSLSGNWFPRKSRKACGIRCRYIRSDLIDTTGGLALAAASMKASLICLMDIWPAGAAGAACRMFPTTADKTIALISILVSFMFGLFLQLFP